MTPEGATRGEPTPYPDALIPTAKLAARYAYVMGRLRITPEGPTRKSIKLLGDGTLIEIELRHEGDPSKSFERILRAYCHGTQLHLRRAEIATGITVASASYDLGQNRLQEIAVAGENIPRIPQAPVEQVRNSGRANPLAFIERTGAFTPKEEVVRWSALETHLLGPLFESLNKPPLALDPRYPKKPVAFR